MNYRSVLSNMSIAFLAQGTAMLFGVLQSLIVPKLLGVESFGYWQLFLFYSSYAGFFHLGLNDGVYLTRGGQARNQIDKRFVYTQFVFGVLFETAIAALIALGALSVHFDANRTFVIICFCFMMVITNAMNFISFTLQAMNETKRSSYIAIVSKVVYIIPLIGFIVLGVEAFQPYIVAYVMSTFVGLLFGMWYMRDFSSDGLTPPPDMVRGGLNSIRIGINLMVSNIAAGLIIGLVRFLIDARWGIATFGKLSLSLSVVNLFLLFVSQASLVLFPALRQSTLGEMKRFFHALRDGMSLFMPAVYLLYYPFVWILSLWLPEYAESLSTFAFLIPICAFDGKMDIYCSTYFKVARKEKTLLRINILSVLFNAVGAFLGAYVFNSVDFILIWAVITIIMRSSISDYIASTSLELGSGLISLQEIAITSAFILFTQTLPSTATLPLYAILYAGYLLLNHKRAAEILRGIRNVFR